jgi:cytochrome subunit of sulfide dehydrogenase
VTAGNQAYCPRRRSSHAAGWFRSCAALLLLIPCAAAPAQEPKSPRPSGGLRVQNGEALADACTSCHGIGGRSRGYIPSLAGAKRTDLMRQLLAFRAQTGQATIMNRIARAYTDSELEALAGYFSSSPGQ